MAAKCFKTKGSRTQNRSISMIIEFRKLFTAPAYLIRMAERYSHRFGGRSGFSGSDSAFPRKRSSGIRKNIQVFVAVLLRMRQGTRYIHSGSGLNTHEKPLPTNVMQFLSMISPYRVVRLLIISKTRENSRIRLIISIFGDSRN